MQKYNKLDAAIREVIQEALDSGMSNRKAAREVLGKESRESSIRSAIKRGVLTRNQTTSPTKPKMLTIDIETAPILANVWGLFQQNISLNMIHQDWYVLSYCAKWAGADGDIYYEDKRDSFNTEDDSDLLKGIWKLLDEADIVTGQNSVRFDTKKLNARFLLNGMPPPSSYRQIDTLQMAKKSFGFTSNKLEYLTDKLCKKYKKLKHGKYAGFEMWKQCLAGNMDAWREMEEYNIHDVLSTEELYTILRPWTKNHLNLNVYNESEEVVCSCGHTEWEHSGYHYTNAAKFDKFKCTSCGAENRGKVNLLPKGKRDSLRSNLT